ncbi:MAG: hypothetical protein LC793_01335 [Thermomicrobia bacterium]|nr:hypothetical protein [Thermomicrobia bacterium]MCA1722679.1 hypothetical protein [Thermomicrobia bacterium]
MNNEATSGLTRREIMKRTLKAGAYAAPLILSASTLSSVAAALPSQPSSSVVSFFQDTGITDVGARARFDVSFTPLDATGKPTAPTAFLGSFITDQFGVGGAPFPLTLDTSVVKAVQLTYTFHATPTPPPSATFTSNLIAAVAPVNGRRSPAQLLGLVVQEPTVAACQKGPLTTFTETLDVALVNVLPGTAYDFYAQPNGLGAPVKVGTATTNLQGNIAVFAVSPSVTSASAPTSVVVTAVLAGASPTPAPYTLTASGATLVTVDCTALQCAQHKAAQRGRALGIAVN